MNPKLKEFLQISAWSAVLATADMVILYYTFQISFYYWPVYWIAAVGGMYLAK